LEREWTACTGIVLHAAEQDESDAVALLLDGGNDVLRAQGGLALTRVQLDERRARIVAVELDLRLDRILHTYTTHRTHRTHTTYSKRKLMPCAEPTGTR
jgi:hypothetical protein